MHKFLKKKFIKPIVKKTIKKFAPELRELMILHWLNKKPSHGYELIKYLHQDIPNGLETKANRVYPSLDHLKKKGYLTLNIDKTHSSKKPRKIYSLTEEGRQHLLTEINELSASLETLREYVNSMADNVKEST